MQQITCPHCEQEVRISPDASRCPRCGENLTHQATPESMSQYYSEQAAAFAEKEEWEKALAAAQTGLESAHTAELLLLAAILSQRLGRFDLMRNYVSQIPTEDVLREEGEWLLRSHQARQRQRRQQAQLLQQERDSLSTEEFAALGTPEPIVAPRSAPRGWPAVVAVLALVVAVWGTWSWFAGPGLEPGLDPAQSTAGTQAGVEALAPLNGDSLGTDAFGTDASSTEALDTDAFSTDGVGGQAGDEETAGTLSNGQPASLSADGTENVSEDVSDTVPGSAPESAPDSTPDNIPDNVVQQSETPEPIADSDVDSAINAANTELFDILAFLENAGRPDLAELSVDAQLQNGTLVIFGVVPWASQRLEILELVETLEGVTEINSVNLVVRLPDTYTVQEGDTLWIIAYRLYAQPERWRDVQAANAALLPSPESLRTNMRLAVPPLE